MSQVTDDEKIHALLKQLDEREATIKQLQEENARLKESLVNLYKEIRSRFAKDDYMFESMSIDLAKPMLAARKLIEP